ncbi:MAG: hypothetical protein J5836_01480 [Clostridia bacterium]|nr:hypothetical protein [Clostridia bacterium]
MDIKITKSRLSNLFTYEWVRLLAITVVIIVLWSIMYTSFAARLSVGQKFFLITYEGVYTKTQSVADELATGAADGGNVLSYDVREFTELNVVTVGENTAHKVLTTRLEGGDGDILIIGNGDREYDPSDRSTLTEYQSLINNGRLISINDLLESARRYTVDSGFIVETDDGYAVNEEKIKRYFKDERRTSSRNYRRTYVTAAEIEKGAQDEVKRIETVYLNYKSVSAAIEEAKANERDFLSYKKKAIVRGDDIITGEEEAYGIDLGKLNAKSKNDIKDLWYVSGEGGASATGMVMAVFEFSTVQPDLQYESLSVMEYIIRKYGDYAE